MKRTVVVLIVTLVCFGVLYGTVGNTILSDTLSNVIGTLGLAYAAFEILRVGIKLPSLDPLRDGWIQLGIAFWIFVIAGAMRASEAALSLGANYGTVADGFFLFGAFPLLNSMRLFISHSEKQTPNGKGYPLPGIAVLAGVYALLFYFFILGQVIDPQRTLFSKVLDVIYPTVDVLVAAASVYLIWLARFRKAFETPFQLLASSFTLLLACDLALSYHSATNSWFYLVLDVPYFCSYILSAFAADSYIEAQSR